MQLENIVALNRRRRSQTGTSKRAIYACRRCFLSVVTSCALYIDNLSACASYLGTRLGIELKALA